MNLVLFLGAGFSKAFGFPIMAVFFSYAKSSRFLTDKEKEKLRSLQRDLNAAASTLHCDPENLEDVLSLAAMSDFQTSDTDYEQLCKILQKVLSIPEGFNPTERIALLQKLLDTGDNCRWRRGEKLTVITTNYDVALDFGLSWLGLRVGLPFKWTGVVGGQGSTSLYKNDSPDCILCKLHGSVNWFVSDNGDGLRAEDSISKIKVPYADSFYWPTICANDYEGPFSATPPIIVPPTYFKGNVHPALSLAWKHAATSIANCDTLIFVGYSFPKSDAHMPYFLASALRSNVDVRRIAIVDPSAKAIASRISDRFGPNFIRKLAPIDGKWEEVAQKGNFCFP